MKLISILITFVLVCSICSCKKENTPAPYRSSFTLNTTKKDAPNAYLRQEGYDPSRQIYYVSLTFATGAVTYDTTQKKFMGYGEAVRYYIYSQSLTEIPSGKYDYTNPINASDLFFKTQKVEVFTNNYSFNFTTNQQGFLYNKTNSGWIDIKKEGNTYNITYLANVGYSNGSVFEPVQVKGDFKGIFIK